MMFGVLWKVVKLFLDKDTLEKVQIHSGGTLKVLKQFIALENIPHFYGGKCQRELEDNPGPWEVELKLSKEENFILTRELALYKRYYLTADERRVENNKENQLECRRPK